MALTYSIEFWEEACKCVQSGGGYRRHKWQENDNTLYC